MSLKKVRTGDELNIPADAYNAFVDAATYARQQTAQSPLSGGKIAATKNTTIVKVKNDSGVALDRFACVCIDDVVCVPNSANLAAAESLEFINNPVFKVKKPTTAGLFLDRWVVLNEPLAIDAIGSATLMGLAVCKVNLGDVNDTHVDVINDTLVPVSGTAGCGRIVWVKGGVGTATATGEQLAVIELGNIEWPYLLITTSTNYNGIEYKWTYTVEVHLFLGSTTALATGKAINLHEWNNTSTSIPGYSDLPDEEAAGCGQVYGCDPIPGCWKKCVGKRFDSVINDWMWEFGCVNELLVGD